MISNPFSTAAVLPGRLQFVFPDDVTLDELLANFARNNSRAQIVGPHGSGKSTLLRNLMSRIENAATNDPLESVQVLELNPRELAESNQLPMLRISGSDCVVVIDGIEQLSPTLQIAMIEWTRKTQIGLLCTCHSPIDNLSVLWTTESNLETFRRVVEQALASRSETILISEQKLREVFDRHHGDVREALFELYDFVRNNA